MQKKLVLALFLAAFVVGGAFAQLQIGMSAGGGVLLDISGNNGIKYTLADDNVLGLPKGDYYSGIRNVSFGAFGFFDATYGEADIYLAFGSLTGIGEAPGASSSVEAGSAVQFGFSLLGKYPIDMGMFTIFPLIGFDYNVVLSIKDKEGEKADKPGDLSQFGILAGAGGDISLAGPLFIRVEGLLHARLPSKSAKDSKTLLTGDGGLKKDDVKTTLGFGAQLKVAVGYRF